MATVTNAVNLMKKMFRSDRRINGSKAVVPCVAGRMNLRKVFPNVSPFVELASLDRRARKLLRDGARQGFPAIDDE
jgi:hypothetical protein